MSGYYVCDYTTHKALKGPYVFRARAAEWILSLTTKQQRRFCTMSRYALAQEGLYPRTKAGDAQLAEDISNAPTELVDVAAPYE